MLNIILMSKMIGIIIICFVNIIYTTNPESRQGKNNTNR